jgi:hypothetical protein
VIRDPLPLLLNSVPGAYRIGLVTWLGPLRHVGVSPPASWHARQFKAIHADALAAVADPSLGLVFVHYPVPHFPGIFDARTGRFASTGVDYYEGNAALADRSLAELRAALERAGLAATTALVVTADHWKRRDETSIRAEVGNPAHRVPLLVHLPGQISQVRASEAISNVASHYLALAVLDGRLEGPADLVGVTATLPSWVRNPR